MNIKELKHKIESNTLDDSPLILKYSDNKYICQQYVDAICKNKNLKQLSISSVSEIASENDFFESENLYLYVLDVEKLDEDILPDKTNLVVISKQLPKDLSIDFIEIPKLIEWQIEDFVAMRLPGLLKEQVHWLCEIAKYDIYRLSNECSKLEIFPKASQRIVFDELNAENAYCDLNSLTIFNFTNAIMRKDLKTIYAVLADLKYIDIEGSGLITIFHKQFKNLIAIQLDKHATANSLNMNPRQFNAIKYNAGTFTDEELINIYEFITGLDVRLKQGDFQFKSENRANNAKFVEYITMNILRLAHIK